MPDYGIVVGDPVYEATKLLIPSVTGYKVDYPASFERDSKIKGAANAVKHVIEASKQCPNQEYVLVGYSQGADVMHSTAVQLPKDLYPRVVALVMFGDPGNRGPNVQSPMGGKVPPFPVELEQKLKQNCEKGDPVCTNSGTDPGAHLQYSDTKLKYMTDSAAYIKKQFESKGKAGPALSPNGGVQDKGNNSAALLELGKMLGGEPGQLEAMAKSPRRLM
jgi:pimeloyl-ACP methyl ester carboxylesterase